MASDTGVMGGRVAHEFHYVTPIGEDRLARCDASGYAANLEVARFRRVPAEQGPARPLRRVATPARRASTPWRRPWRCPPSAS
ncbi:MAG: hypothetical protein R3F59_28465 [Myxococcota bacterium]